MKFNGFSLDTKLVSSLNQLGYIELTPIQEKTIVSALKKNSFIKKNISIFELTIILFDIPSCHPNKLLFE